MLIQLDTIVNLKLRRKCQGTLSGDLMTVQKYVIKGKLYIRLRRLTKLLILVTLKIGRAI